jgi:hypothetical protein
MDGNPFEPGTKVHKCFGILSDHQWHCGKHGLPGTQSAALVKQIVDRGYKVEKYNKFCLICQEDNVHRRLVNTLKRN